MDVMPELDLAVDMVLADPPYGTTQCSWDNVITLESMWEYIWKITKTNAAVVMTAQTPFDKVLGCSCLEYLKYEWIWEKHAATGHLNARKMPMKAHENILVFYKKLPTYNPQKTTGHRSVNSYHNHQTFSSVYGETKRMLSGGGSTERYPRSVQRLCSDKQCLPLHPTQKPVSLFSYMIKTYTNADETVMDFCAGSGTTAVAAERTGRKWICIEKEEKYCEVIAKRMEVMNMQGQLF